MSNLCAVQCTCLGSVGKSSSVALCVAHGTFSLCSQEVTGGVQLPSHARALYCRASVLFVSRAWGVLRAAPCVTHGAFRLR